MAYRNPGRSWLAAAVFALSAVTPLLGAAAPAAAADNVTITVTVRDDGFSQSAVDARVGDYLIVKLDDAAMGDHTLAWDQGQIKFTFAHSPGRNYRKYGPLNAGTLHFYDADHVSGYAAGGPFTGVLSVTDAPPPPPPPPSSSSTTTTVTSPPSTATTTTTMAPTTTSTEPGSVRPFLVPDAPTTTTTAAHSPAGSGAGSAKGNGTTTTGNKDKGKDKAAAAETTTTLAPAPPAALPDSIFDAESLTPSPTTLPDPQSVGDPDDETALNASSILSLLDPEKAVDNDNTRPVLLIAAGALGLLVFVGGLWCWGHRASRYDPA